MARDKDDVNWPLGCLGWIIIGVVALVFADDDNPQPLARPSTTPTATVRPSYLPTITPSATADWRAYYDGIKTATAKDAPPTRAVETPTDRPRKSESDLATRETRETRVAENRRRMGYMDCEDFETRDELNEYMDAYPGDPSNLDGDDDGYACERGVGEDART